jgi:hypothetical protein
MRFKKFHGKDTARSNETASSLYLHLVGEEAEKQEGKLWSAVVRGGAIFTT